jgi:hypothetical protein
MVVELSYAWEMVVKKRCGLIGKGAASALFACWLVPGSAAADLSAEVELLRQQVRDLQARVEQIEGRVQQGLPVNRALEVQPVAGGWREEFNWSLLDSGMQTFRVSEILGEPERRRSVSKFDYWHYGEDGLLRFYMGRLKSWEVPGGIGTP